MAKQLASLGRCYTKLGQTSEARDSLERSSGILRDLRLPAAHPTVAMVAQLMAELG